MKNMKTGLALMAVSGALAFAGPAQAMNDDDNVIYKITVTNITSGQVFTPLLAASHRRGIKLFTLGEPAGEALATLAESGETAPLRALLEGSPKVLEVATAGGALPPGASVILFVDTKAQFRYISLAGMLVPTNDAFVALNAVRGPKGNKRVTYFARAYDAGSEVNDESCANIPGPPNVCTGEGESAADGEGYVHVHDGIHGTGDLAESVYDWRNPVAKVTIRRLPE